MCTSRERLAPKVDGAGERGDRERGDGDRAANRDRGAPASGVDGVADADRDAGRRARRRRPARQARRRRARRVVARRGPSRLAPLATQATPRSRRSSATISTKPAPSTNQSTATPGCGSARRPGRSASSATRRPRPPSRRTRPPIADHADLDETRPRTAGGGSCRARGARRCRSTPRRRWRASTCPMANSAVSAVSAAKSAERDRLRADRVLDLRGLVRSRRRRDAAAGLREAASERLRGGRERGLRLARPQRDVRAVERVVVRAELARERGARVERRSARERVHRRRRCRGSRRCRRPSTVIVVVARRVRQLLVRASRRRRRSRLPACRCSMRAAVMSATTSVAVAPDRNIRPAVIFGRSTCVAHRASGLAAIEEPELCGCCDRRRAEADHRRDLRRPSRARACR